MRRMLSVAVVLAVEGYLYYRYALLGAHFHFWLHALFGAALGCSLLAVFAVVRRRPLGNVWGVGLTGHLYSAFPDLLFIGGGVLHYLWMDAFALHISLHFIPAPLVTMLAVFALSLGGWAAATLGRRRVAVGLVGCAVVATTAALSVRTPLPTSLEEFREERTLAFFCPLVVPPSPFVRYGEGGQIVLEEIEE